MIQNFKIRDKKVTVVKFLVWDGNVQIKPIARTDRSLSNNALARIIKNNFVAIN